MRAFTLIELLIVIAIIGILASVIVISLSDNSESAESARAKFNVAQAARYAHVQIANGETAEDKICPASSTQTPGTADDTLYCDYASSKFVVYEKYKATGNPNAWCMDESDGNPATKNVTALIAASAGC